MLACGPYTVIVAGAFLAVPLSDQFYLYLHSGRVQTRDLLILVSTVAGGLAAPLLMGTVSWAVAGIRMLTAEQLSRRSEAYRKRWQRNLAWLYAPIVIAFIIGMVMNVIGHVLPVISDTLYTMFMLTIFGPL